MKFATVLASIAVGASALATPEVASELVARDATFCFWPFSCGGSSLSLSLGLNLGLGSSGCNAAPCTWWSCPSSSYGGYTIGSYNFPKIWGGWSHVCNQVYYGNSWSWLSQGAWSSGYIGWQECGAFAQQGISLTVSASFGSWYGTSKGNWQGFCKDLWNNHYSQQQPCTKSQWQGYLNKWGVQEGSYCH